MTGWMLDRPRFAAALLAVLILLPLAALPRLKLDNSPETYLPTTAPAVVFNQELRRQFPEDQVLVALFGGPALWDTATLKKIQQLGDTLEQSPLVERVLSVTSADHIAPTTDGFSVAPLINLREAGAKSAAEWRRRALADRFAPGLLAAPDGSTLALIVRPHQLRDSRQRALLELLLRDTITQLGLDPRLTAIGGPVALDAAQLKSMMADGTTFTPITTALGLGLLWWMFRRRLVVVLASLTFAAVTGSSVALLALSGKPFTLVDSMLPPLLLALSTAALMHLFSGVVHASQRQPTPRARVLDSINHVRRPALFAALTTVAGLLSLAVTPIRPITDFGIAGGAGVAVTYLVTVWLLPSLILRFDRGPWRVSDLGLRRLDAVVRRTTRIALRRPGWVLGSFGVLLLAGAPQLANIRVQTDLYKFFPDSHPLTQATHAIEQSLSGVIALEVVFDAADRDGLTDPAALRAIAATQAWLKQQPEVDYTLSLPDLITEMHWAFRGGGEAPR
ncbi:MAG: efflux RND transporter permease subunit, partial [Immundisolibacter sp.]|uniref:efflux RND transporter permease subunit n=1 Tax=Immundisolibacter sp. TaxID=1934948 RepID=UPI003EE0051C